MWQMSRRSMFYISPICRESESLSRLLDLYVSQSRYHWQEPNVLTWLEANVVAVLGLVEPIVVDADVASVHERNVQSDERLRIYSERWVGGRLIVAFRLDPVISFLYKWIVKLSRGPAFVYCCLF